VTTKVTVRIDPPPKEDEATDERVVTLPENVTLTASASQEARTVVEAMAERILMDQGYREMADETLALAREARSAQIRALREA
jgi:hypothetical protein